MPTSFATRSRNPQSANTTSSRKTVLCIDDDRSITASLALFLKVMNFKVQCAQSVGQGLHKLSEFRPDAIVTDLSMPDGNAEKLIADLKSNPLTSSIPLFVLTGFSDSDVENRLEAVNAVKAQDFDLVLMDVQMPGMDGYEATAAIRDLEKNSNRRLPIVAMTANALKGDREKCLNAGMDEYISKPIQREHFLDTIKKLLQTEGQVNPPQDGKSSPEETVTAIKLHPTVSAQNRNIPWNELLDLVGGEPDTLLEIVQSYLEELKELSSSIPQAIQQNDADTLCRSSHKLKSALRFLRQNAIANRAEQLEQRGSRAELSGVDVEYVEVQQALSMLIDEVRDFCADPHFQSLDKPQMDIE